MEGQDLLLDAALEHQAVDRDGPGLAHAVGAVTGLVFHRRIPPGIHVDDVVGGGEVEARATGLEADEEELALSGLEGLDRGRPLAGRGGTVEILVADAPLVQGVAQEAQVIHELAEDQGAVTVLPELVHQFQEGLQLGGGDVQVLLEQLGVAAGAAQAGEGRQHLEGLAFAVLEGGQALPAQGFEEAHLLG